MIRTNKIVYVCLFSSFCFASTASFATAKRAPIKPATGICANAQGDYTCLVYNYAEQTVVASYPKVDPKDKSPEQRNASFPSKLIGDNGAKYTLMTTSSTSFKPFSVIYSNGGNGCMFTFSPPATADQKTAPTGYVVSAKGVGSYSDDSCQRDGATLTVKG